MGLLWRADASRYLSDASYALWKRARQAGLGVHDDEQWGRILEAEKARQAGPSAAPAAAPTSLSLPRTRTERQREADRDRAAAKAAAAQREAEAAAWKQQEDVISRLGDLGM